MKKHKPILVADGGSTKVDWVLIQKEKDHKTYHTSGLNPYIVSSEVISKEIEEKLSPVLGDQLVAEISEIYFYGAGCSSKKNCNSVKDGISKIFPNATIIVDHDLLGAVKALCGNDPGVACILGTGSSCCVYNGKKITDELNCLGHLAGDEGSGNYMGKMVLQSYCYGTMPLGIRADFIEKYKLNPKEIVAELYSKEKPNAYIATFTQFLLEQIEHSYAKDIIRISFKDFIVKNVMTLDFPKGMSINFTGSVAYYFQDILKEVLKEYQLPLGKIIRKPITGMVEYHS